MHAAASCPGAGACPACVRHRGHGPCWVAGTAVHRTPADAAARSPWRPHPPPRSHCVDASSLTASGSCPPGRSRPIPGTPDTHTGTGIGTTTVQGAEVAVGVSRLALLFLTVSSDLLLLPSLGPAWPAWRPASPRTWINVTHLAALQATALVRARPSSLPSARHGADTRRGAPCTGAVLGVDATGARGSLGAACSACAGRRHILGRSGGRCRCPCSCSSSSSSTRSRRDRARRRTAVAPCAGTARPGYAAPAATAVAHPATEPHAVARPRHAAAHGVRATICVALHVATVRPALCPACTPSKSRRWHVVVVVVAVAHARASSV